MPEPDTHQPHAALRLREVHPDDLPLLYQYQLDPESNKLAAVHPRSESVFAAHWQKSLSDPTIIARVILLNETVVGSIACFRMEGLDSIGYWIAREHWGKGIATRALTLLLQVVTKRPLHARAARENSASIRVLTNCGFRIVRYEFSPGTDRYIECEEAILILD